MPAKLEYAHKFEDESMELVHITQVESGLVCNCYCPHCKAPLIAKNKRSNKVAAHFQHYKPAECSYAVETSLHLLAKEVFMDMGQIKLPVFKEKYFVKDNLYRGFGPLFDEVKEFMKPELVPLQKVEVEKGLDGFRPDVIIWVRGEPILVEIYVTHKVDQEKLKRIHQRSIATIEIDLHKEKRQLSKELLQDIFMSATHSKWIYHPAVEIAKQDFKRDLKKIVDDERRRRTSEMDRITRKRWKRDQREEYLDKAKTWINSRTPFAIRSVENKNGYAIYKKIEEQWIVGCPIMRAPTIRECLFCDYNPRFNSTSKNRYLNPEDQQIGYVQCLYDLMKDRYESK